MRGKVHFIMREFRRFRITPAYAGKSFRKTAVRHAIKDHPRLCGEKISTVSGKMGVTGSPPPMRGKGHFCPSSFSSSRITPAYAGKRPKDGTAKKADWDHPRLCGEKLKQMFLDQINTGSPPPMRGKVGFIHDRGSRDRITPAYAGKRCRRPQKIF